jgi:hypothetical protein
MAFSMSLRVLQVTGASGYPAARENISTVGNLLPEYKTVHPARRASAVNLAVRTPNHVVVQK